MAWPNRSIHLLHMERVIHKSWPPCPPWGTCLCISACPHTIAIFHEAFRKAIALQFSQLLNAIETTTWFVSVHIREGIVTAHSPNACFRHNLVWKPLLCAIPGDFFALRSYISLPEPTTDEMQNRRDLKTLSSWNYSILYLPMRHIHMKETKKGATLPLNA